ncbi:MAG: hypothetical protein R2836_07125 [Chitinophagales bacterium]|nr:hypothetical protein [Chitinophagales bacterium]
MTQNFTFNDLILYYYNELPKDKTNALQIALEFDATLKEDFKTIQEITSLLDKEKKSPSTFSINYILDYSKKSNGELETI